MPFIISTRTIAGKGVREAGDRNFAIYRLAWKGNDISRELSRRHVAVILHYNYAES